MNSVVWLTDSGIYFIIPVKYLVLYATPPFKVEVYPLCDEDGTRTEVDVTMLEEQRQDL
jgi:hypothetical protein